jgi:hypothetical protein
MIKNYYKLIVALLFATNVFGQNLPSYLPKDGLVGWWPFNGNANDESGNGNHGTVNGAKLNTDRNGNYSRAYSFDGLSNFIELNNTEDLVLNNGLTFSAWFNSNDIRMASIVDKETFPDEGYGYRLNIRSDNEIWAEHGSYGIAPTGTMGAFAKNAYTTKIWTHVVGVLNKIDGINSIFVNGKLIDSKTINLLISNSKKIQVGRASFVDKEFFNGIIDDIAIYNRALTEAEVQALFTGTPLCTTPPTPKVNPTVTTCAGNSISFEATGATGIETYNWYDVAEGGTPIATSQIVKTPVLNYGENKTYWVSITNGVCESTRARVDVIVKELPTVKKPENYSVCAGEFIQSLNFTVTPQGATNYWSNDNTVIGLSSSGMGAIPGFKTPSNINSPIVSNITVTPSFNGCIGKSETFKIYVIPTPKVTITNLKPIVFTTDAPFALVGEPAGGNFIGEAIEGNNFTPAKATLGKKSIEYKYITKDGCGGAVIASTIVVDTNGVVCTKYDTIKVKETIYDTVLKITFKLTTGINISKTTSLSVYPNPTADNLIIDAADIAAMSGYSYQLLDAVGKEIYSQLVTFKKTEISLKTLGAKGVYVLHVLDANNQSVVSKKIVLE